MLTFPGFLQNDMPLFRLRRKLVAHPKGETTTFLLELSQGKNEMSQKHKCLRVKQSDDADSFVELSIGEEVSCLELKAYYLHLTDDMGWVQNADFEKLTKENCIFARVRTSKGIEGYVSNALLEDVDSPPKAVLREAMSNPTFKAFMMGTIDEGSPVAKLSSTLCQSIYLEFVKEVQEEHVLTLTLALTLTLIRGPRRTRRFRRTLCIPRQDQFAWRPCSLPEADWYQCQHDAFRCGGRS